MEQWKNKISSCVTVAEQYLAETKDDAVMDTAVLDELRVELAALNSVTDEQLNGVVVDYFE
ncbi:MAG: hypothetical protein LBC29_05055, partial [Propionibacteriaceae bacterium]|nr:hypothetical protein [Propionibacteriaceae bacterium]